MRCAPQDGFRETDGKSAAPRAMRCYRLPVAPLPLPKRRRRHNRTPVAKGWLQACEHISEQLVPVGLLVAAVATGAAGQLFFALAVILA